jgi:ubiquinone biosynthesis protein
MKMADDATFLRRLAPGIGDPVAFRQFLERRGPIFVKIGQFLALRPDLIAPEYCEELMRLFERVRPFSWAEARQTMKEDLGAEPAELFAYIDSNPLATGSLAQTYYARLRDGTEVAVKVLRPDIRQQVARDLRHARRLARLLDASGSTFIWSPRDVVEELASWLEQEMDLRRELSNMRRLRRLTAESKFQVVPRSYRHLCGPRVLTTGYVRGVHVIDLLAPRPGSRRPILSDPVDRGVDRDVLAENLILACLTQIFRYRFFHADLHPGNLIALPRDRLAFVDFGLCEELDETVRRHQMRYLAALYGRDNEKIFRSLLEILEPTERADAEALRRDFFASVRASESSSSGEPHAANGAYTSPVANYMIAIMRAARRNGYRVPSRILAMYRALLTSESVAHQLGSKVDLRSVGGEFVSKQQSEEALNALDLENLQPALLSYLALWRESPGQLSQILSDLADNRFVLKTNVSENPDLKQDRNRRTRAVVTSIVAVSVAVLIAFPGPSLDAETTWQTWGLVAVLLVLYLVTYLHYRKLK